LINIFDWEASYMEGNTKSNFSATELIMVHERHYTGESGKCCNYTKHSDFCFCILNSRINHAETFKVLSES
jgi:hypothetical protein